MTDCCDRDVTVFGHDCDSPLPGLPPPTWRLQDALDIHADDLADLMRHLADLHATLRKEHEHTP